MTRDDINRMEREAADKDKADPHHNGFWVLTQDQLERFAVLVADAQREACAQLCESYDDDCGAGETWGPRFAALIRARGEE